MTDKFILLALGFTMLTAITSWLLLRLYQDEERTGLRLTGARRGFGRRAPTPDATRPKRPDHTVVLLLREVITRLGALIANSGLMPRTMLADLKNTLVMSGMTSSGALGMFIGSKLLLLTLLPLLALFLLNGRVEPSTQYAAAAAAAAIGLLGPDWIARKLRDRYIERVQGGLPDALDLLLICAQSGLALEGGLARVELEMRNVHPDLSWELAQTVAELQVMSDSRIALANLGTRTSLDGLKRLSSTLIQTMQFGTPLSEALRLLALEMRHEMMMNFEAKAARLPVLLTLPMVVFIMPSVFIVIGGPAVIQLMRGFMA